MMENLMILNGQFLFLHFHGNIPKDAFVPVSQKIKFAHYWILDSLKKKGRFGCDFFQYLNLNKSWSSLCQFFGWQSEILKRYSVGQRALWVMNFLQTFLRSDFLRMELD